MIKPQRFKAVLSKKEKISSKVYDVRLKLVDPPEIEFLPGHTIMVYIADGINRLMSIASPPTDKTELTICWDISPMGLGCQWLLARQVGDSVEFMGPLGVFLYDEQSPRKAVFVATGSGISPFHSYVATYLSDGKMKESVLYWGLRHEEDMFWNDYFIDMAKTHPNFHYHLIFSKPQNGWTGRQGHVEKYVFSEEHDIVNSDFYLCGSGKMVDEMTQLLKGKGVQEGQIKKEMFFKE